MEKWEREGRKKNESNLLILAKFGINLHWNLTVLYKSRIHQLLQEILKIVGSNTKNAEKLFIRIKDFNLFKATI